MKEKNTTRYDDLLGNLLSEGVSTTEKKRVRRKKGEEIKLATPEVDNAPLDQENEQMPSAEEVIDTTGEVAPAISEEQQISDNPNVQALSAEELAAAMGEIEPAISEEQQISDNPNVQALSAEELAAAMGEIAPEVALPSEEQGAEEQAEESVDLESEEPFEEDKELEEQVEKQETTEEEDNIEEPEQSEEVAEDALTEESQTNENEHVSGVSQAELDAARAAFDKLAVSDYADEFKEEQMEEEVAEEEEFDLEDYNETTPVYRDLTPEELEKQKQDEELLSKLDEETRREYERLARKYSYNPIKNNDKLDVIVAGAYNEEFDFEKRTNIPKVGQGKKNKPLIAVIICLAIIIAVMVPVYFFVIRKPNTEVVYYTGLAINQKDIYCYSNSYIELDNMYMIASYSNGSKKYIKCTKDNISVLTPYISKDLFISAGSPSRTVTLQFKYEGKAVSVELNICRPYLEGIEVEYYNSDNLKVGDIYSVENIFLFGNYDIGAGGYNVDDEGIERLPGQFSKLLSETEISAVEVTVECNGVQVFTGIKYSDVVTAGGFSLSQEGNYVITLKSGLSIATIEFSVAAV